jgi:hypothetical protein
VYNKEYQSVPRYTPTPVLVKQGLTAAGGLIGGIGLLIMGSLPPVGGIVLGAVAGVLGIGALCSKDPEEKKPGAIMTAAGCLAILSRLGIPVIKPLAGAFLGIGALGFLAMGVWNGFKFLQGLKSRR